jgi:HAD superfamily hydrolase (TIGR01484 family)
MRYRALVCDFDGTLAEAGAVPASTIGALESLAASGRKIVMATGRILEEVLALLPQPELFDRIVAENGAVVYHPQKRREQLLSEAPPPAFLKELAERGVAPVASGKVIVATWEPHEVAALEAIREMGLDLQVIFNKGAVMILPQGITKATGMLVALRELGLSHHNAVGIGDAENDHAFLTRCECAVAVSNALQSVKERVDLVTTGDHGRGVEELADRLLATDLAEMDIRLQRHYLLLGRAQDAAEVKIPPYESRVLIAGPSGSGKSTAVTALLERLAKAEYQYCVVDPEGDYQSLPNAVGVGDVKSAPAGDEVVQLLEQFSNPVVNLLGISLADRPAFFRRLWQKLLEVHDRTGRPHWVILDEAHHMLPVKQRLDRKLTPPRSFSCVMITVHPDQVNREVLQDVNLAIAVGESPSDTFTKFGEQLNLSKPSLQGEGLDDSHLYLWRCRESSHAIRIRLEPSEIERKRHRRKYAEGDVQERSFHFRGPDSKLNLKAQNLMMFVQLAEGVDDETWLFHLKRQEYSAWMRTAIKDDDLAATVASIETADLPPAESRNRIKAAIEDLYTEPPSPLSAAEKDSLQSRK